MSRSVLLIMTFALIIVHVKCNLFDQCSQAKYLSLQKVFRYLKIRRDSKVADIGAGRGWLTILLAQFVGPKGKVYSEDVLPQQISYIIDEVKRNQLNNVDVILGSPSNPKLPANTLDAVMMINVYHEFEKPMVMLKHIQHAMKSGGRLGIIDRDNDHMRQEAHETYAKTGYVRHRFNETMINNYLRGSHYLALVIVKRELASIGFKFLFSRELAGDHYVAIFIKS